MASFLPVQYTATSSWRRASQGSDSTHRVHGSACRLPCVDGLLLQVGSPHALRVCLCLCKRQLAAEEESVRLRSLPYAPVGRRHRLHVHRNPTSVFSCSDWKNIEWKTAVELTVGFGVAGSELQCRPWELHWLFAAVISVKNHHRQQDTIEIACWTS